MDKLGVRHALDAAKKQIEEGDCAIAYRILEPLIEEEIAEALYLFSMFRLPTEESEREFELRSVRLLEKAAQSEYPPAQYALGVEYDFGGLVARDRAKASDLFRAAAINEHPKAQLSHGLDLYHGSNGVQQDMELGVAYINRAISSGVEEAVEALTDLKQNESSS